MASVPDTNTFHLTNVITITGGTSLTAAFTNSVDAFFNPTYKGSKDRLSNFRDYDTDRVQVGDTHQGGVVIYLDGTGGGIVASTAYRASASWQNSTSNLTTSATYGEGGTNTDTISDGGLGAYISPVASAIVGYGGSWGYDAFLPTTEEMEVIHANKAYLPSTFTDDSGDIYWTSHDSGTTTAYYVSLYSGTYSAVSADKTVSRYGLACHYF